MPKALFAVGGKNLRNLGFLRENPMSSVWLCIPSKKPAAEAQAVIDRWRARGYGTAIWRDAGDDPVDCDLLLTGEYPGYAKAVNALCGEVLARSPEVEWLVTGGDDTEPDPAHDPGQIAQECTEHFGGTFGIMQPTGHRWGDAGGAYIDRICGSPWMGREWCQRANQGQGPLYPGFSHMFVDDCLQAVAQKLGILWQRRDLTHLHQHWGLPHSGERAGKSARMPEYIKKWNTAEHWQESKALLEQLRVNGFAPCLPVS